MLFLKAGWPNGMSFKRCSRAGQQAALAGVNLGSRNREIANSKPCVSTDFRIQSGPKLIPESMRPQLASTSKSPNVRRNCEI
jgi:hypothetical protein